MKTPWTGVPRPTAATLRMVVAFVVAVAAVATRPTVAAPQQTDDRSHQVITIAGQSCKCGPFYVCEDANTVNVPEGSTERGCTDGLVCCRLNNDMPVTELVITSESSHYISSTMNPNVIEQNTCQCVRTSQCMVNNEEINEQPNFDVRVGNCNRNQVCCNRENILTDNLGPDTVDNNNNGNNQNHGNNNNNGNNQNHGNNNNNENYGNIDINNNSNGNNHNNGNNNNNNDNYNNNNGNNNNANNNNANNNYEVDNNGSNCGIGLPAPRTTDSENLGTRIIASPEENSKTYFGQYPWMVVVLTTDINEDTGARTENVFQCGGSLIHPRVVLTAAHCVRNKNMNLLKVRVGEWNTQSNENEEEKKSSHQDIGIHQIVVHPKFNNATMFNDVALIILESDAVLKEHINTICIPNNEERLNYDAQSCVSTGWGKDAFDASGRYQTILKKVDLSLVPNDLCQQRLRNTRLGNFFRLHESFICAGGVKGVDVCKGDGGGPLICAVRGGRSTDVQKYVQVGIVSWGIGCGDQNVPGVYASLEANSIWINQQLKNIVR